MNQPFAMSEDALLSSVAVVGMACRFPGAADVQEFWDNLKAGVESIRFFGRQELLAAGLDPQLVEDPDFVPARGVLEHPEHFDASFFQISPREAQLLDPQHRVLLECAWEALEHAGYVAEDFDGDIGFFGGCFANTYLLNQVLANRELLESLGGIQAILTSDKDHLATRISYKLGLTGPSATVQSACSTSLVAVQMAVLSLLNYQSDMALAGGVSITVPSVGGHRYQPGLIFSSDGHCRAFDHRAEGTVGGDGAGLVVLRRLEDALEDGDGIHAVIRGAAINNDGGRKIGYTAPSIEGQARVIRDALAMADVPARSIQYVEAHGTGTALGDPVELAALTQAFGEETEERGFCGLGSVKTNVGHLNTAAGIAGLLKAILSLKHGYLPASLHFEAPNPKLRLEQSPFYVVSEGQAWPAPEGAPRRAGVSSFGAGGTNAHVILEEAPPRPPAPRGAARRHFLPLSARTPAALERASERLLSHLQRHPQQPLEDVAFTLQRGRKAWSCRRVVLADHHQQAIAALSDPAQPVLQVEGKAPEDRLCSLVFLYPAQGSQKINAGRGLYEEGGIFRREVDRCCALLEPLLDRDLRELLFPPEAEQEVAQSQLNDQYYAGLALFVISYALTARLRELGIEPWAVAGLSTGEYVAACVAGILRLEDALSLLVERGRLIDTLPDGGALALPMSAEEAQPHLVEGAHIALRNSPFTCVVSGQTEPMQAQEARLKSLDIPVRRLRVSAPPHNPVMEPLSKPLREALSRLSFHPPQIPLVSGVTGAVLSAQEAQDPEHWVRHLLEPVRFDGVMKQLARQAEDEGSKALFLEVGPHNSMTPLVLLNLPEHGVVASLPPTPGGYGDNEAQAARLRAALWAHGGAEPWESSPKTGRRVPLPTYPFEPQVHWAQASDAGVARKGLSLNPSATRTTGASTAEASQRHPRPDLPTAYVPPQDPVEQTLAEICQGLLGVQQVGIHDDLFALGGDSVITLRLVQEIEQSLQVKLPASAAFRGRDVARMAAFVREAGGEAPADTRRSHHPHDDILIPIQTQGARPPLFLVHPASGVIFPYFELGRSLELDQPVYGLQAQGLDGEASPDKTTAQLARRYAKLMRQVQPKGPYFVAGYSYGAYIAYEIALQLHEAGETVPFVGLIDAIAPLPGIQARLLRSVRSSYSLARSAGSFFYHLQNYLFLATKERETNAASGLRNRLGALVGRRGMRSFFRGAAVAAMLSPDSHLLTLHQPAMGPMLELFLLHFWEALRYTPRQYPGRLTLFKSDWWEQQPWFAPFEIDATLEWRHLALGGVDTCTLKGDHLGLLKSPHLKHLVNSMRREIQKHFP